MTIKSVRKFSSSDGRLHDTYQEAKRHDAQQKVIVEVRRFFRNIGVNEGSTFPLDLANRPELAQTLKILMDGVISYHKKYGKWKNLSLKTTLTPEDIVYATAMPAPKPVTLPKAPAPVIDTTTTYTMGRTTKHEYGVAAKSAVSVPTGFKALDDNSRGGMAKGTLTLFSANSGVGKSQVQVAASAQKKGIFDKKTVKKYNQNGELLHTYESAAEAAKSANVHPSSVSKVCRGEQKTAAGFYWAYNDEAPRV